jgi:hypothetical protein
MYGLFDVAVSSAEYIISNGRLMLNIELERMWKIMVMV